MLKKIAGTLITRVFAAAISFAILVITAKLLGAEIRGEISLVVFGLTIIVLVNDVFGGPALVFFVPRNRIKRLLLPAYLWAIAVCAALAFPLGHFGIIPPGYELHTFYIALLQCLGSIHLVILLGKEKIKLYNIINIVQVSALLLALAVLIFLLNERSVFSWIFAAYCSYGISLALSSLFIIREMKEAPASTTSSRYSHILRNGFFTQAASLAHLLTNRISFYFLNAHPGLGVAAVGVYSTGAAVAEALLLLSNSVATVIYARIANSNDLEHSRQLTLRLAKLCILVTLPGIAILLLLPVSFYTFLISEEFYYMKKVIAWLGMGILAQSFSAIIIHYFSGLGKNYINMISACISLTVTASLSAALVPDYHLSGAAVAASAAHCVSAGFLVVMFLYETRYSVLQLLPSVEDYRGMKRDFLNFVQFKR